MAPFDRLLQFPGWAAVNSDRTAVHAERSDVLDAQLPTWITLKNQIRRGESPLWYPNGSGGQPISLELLSPSFLLFVLIKDNALAYYFVGLTKLVISGIGTYLLLRIFLGWLSSVWGGIVFMLCGFNAAWFFWEHVATAMWIPWLLWATVMYLKTENRKWLPAITITSLLMILGGFPSIAAFGFYSFGLLILLWNINAFFFKRERHLRTFAGSLTPFMKSSALPLLAAGISFVMAAVVLVPFRDFISGINLGYRTSGGQPLSVNDLALFLSYESPPRVERTAYIGIASCVLALAGIFRIFASGDSHLKSFILFNVSLVIITVLIAFGQLPHRLIEALPVFKNNPKWGRLIVITLLSLAASSAIGLDFCSAKLRSFLPQHLKITPLNAGRVIAVMMIVLIAIQFHSQKKLFNGFNAVVPAVWFYPMTPSIRYVKENLKPLQSVIADDSYWFSGTLGAYGIPEWYSHSFRTDREKQVLGELVRGTFTSPTSIRIDGGKIELGSPLMDRLAIKYLILNKKALDTKQVLELQGLPHDPVPPLPYNSWRQHIYLTDDMAVGAVGFMFDTYGKGHAPANVRLTIYKDNGQQFKIEPELDKDEVTDNQWNFFIFPGRVPLSKGGYYLELSMPGYTGTGRLTARAMKSLPDTGSFLELNGSRADFSLKWGIGYYGRTDLSALDKKWNVIDLEKEVMILENRDVTKGAYFIKSIDTSSNSSPDYSGLDVRQTSADRIDIDCAEKCKGWVVLPMHLDPGWKAYVDGRQVKYDTYLDMLPAIPVEGRSNIVFKYQSASFRKGLTVSMAGVFIFIVFLGYCYRREKQKNEPQRR